MPRSVCRFKATVANAINGLAVFISRACLTQLSSGCVPFARMRCSAAFRSIALDHYLLEGLAPVSDEVPVSGHFRDLRQL